MKTVSKKELEVKASKEFKKFPNAKQLHATVDGNIFLEKNRAELHSEDIIYTFDRPGDSNQKDSNSEGTNNDVNEKIDYRVAIKTIQEAKTLSEIKPFEKDDRKTVKAAYDSKNDELVKELDVNN